ncbi:MAG: DUF1573 domain-containing protein [Porphyromonadaceae bacterium]|nr:DUF1573 domain-containing protein [Porphyromonadaceae bacterium]
MKKLMYVLVFLFAYLGFSPAIAQGSQQGAVIMAKETEHDFGVIKESNGKVSHTFVIKNTGSAPLVLTRVVAACGCTTPEYSTEPIAPGKEGKILVTFNPVGRPGQFVKTIAIYSNGKDGSYILRVKGLVE